MFLHLSVSHSVHRCGDFQAHTHGDVGGLAMGRGAQGPHWMGVSRPIPGGVSRPRPGCWLIPACTEADTPQWTVTAAGGMHLTGMHSCLCKNVHRRLSVNHSVRSQGFLCDHYPYIGDLP